jgi:hypothetical protein
VRGVDLVLKNGVILSVTLDGKRINGTAVAVKDGLIVKVGADTDMEEYISGNTKVIDAAATPLCPACAMRIVIRQSPHRCTSDATFLASIFRKGRRRRK